MDILMIVFLLARNYQ